jgi:hypothetical protein
VGHAAVAQMLAHGQPGLAAANNKRIYFLNGQIPVHFWFSNMLSRHCSSRYIEPMALDEAAAGFPYEFCPSSPLASSLNRRRDQDCS